MSVQEAEELFRGEEVVARLFRRGGATCVVTFDNHQDDSSLDRKAFGQDYLAGQNLSAIHVMTRENRWYQQAEMVPALAAVREATSGFDRVITYGSSMGAYAAIRFADRVGATDVVAMSPQYSVRPSIMPRENRSRRDVRAIRWRADADGPIACRARPIIFYDPYGLDGYQVDRICQDIDAELIGVKYSAHPMSSYMAHDGYITRVVPQIIAGTFDPDHARPYLRGIRKDNFVYLCELANLQPRHRARWRVRLAERAVEVSNGYNLAHYTLAQAWRARREFERALPYFEKAAEASRGHIGYLNPYRDTLIQAGRMAEALRVTEQIVANSQGAKWALAKLARVKWYASSPLGCLFISARRAVSRLAWNHLKRDIW